MSSSNTAAIASIYNSRAAAYEDAHHIQQTQSYIAHLTQFLQPGASLLDLACGTGLLTIPAKIAVGAGGRVVGVDVAAGMLDVARRKSREQSVDIEWLEHDVSDLSGLGLGDFALITCASALVLLPDPAAAVRNWAGMLKPGGRVMTDVQLPGANVVMDIFATIGPQIGETLKWDMTRFRSLASLTRLMVEAGLEVEQAWESEVYNSTVIDVGNAEQFFEEAVQKAMFANFGADGIREKSRIAFVKRLKELGGSQGKIEQDLTFWMCIARKTI